MFDRKYIDSIRSHCYVKFAGVDEKTPTLIVAVSIQARDVSAQQEQESWGARGCSLLDHQWSPRGDPYFPISEDM